MAIRKEAAEALETSVAPQSAGAREGVEWTAGPLRPVAHWVTMPAADGRPRLQMIWEVPNPIASHVM